MTSKAVTRSVTNGFAQVFEAAAKNTNQFRLEFNGWGATIKIEQNMGSLNAPPTAVGFNVTPMTTLRVEPTK